AGRVVDVSLVLLVRREVVAERECTRGAERVVGRLEDLLARGQLLLRRRHLIGDVLQVGEQVRRQHALRDALGHRPTVPVRLTSWSISWSIAVSARAEAW